MPEYKYCLKSGCHRGSDCHSIIEIRGTIIAKSLKEAEKAISETKANHNEIPDSLRKKIKAEIWLKVSPKEDS